MTQNHSRFCPRSTCLGIKQQIHQSVSGLNKTLYQVDTCGFFPCLHHNQAHLAIFVASARNEKNIGTSEIVIFTVNDLGPKHFQLNCFVGASITIWHNKKPSGPSIGCQISIYTHMHVPSQSYFRSLLQALYNLFGCFKQKNVSCNNKRFSTRKKTW